MKNAILFTLLTIAATANAQFNDRDFPAHSGRGGFDRQERRPLPPRFDDGQDDDFRVVYGGDLQIGRTVFTRVGQTGTVQAIFSNGDVMVDISGFRQTKKRDDLAVEGCRRIMRKRICTGDTAYTAVGQTSRVRGFFPSNEIIVDVSGFLQVKTRDDLAVAGCSSNICSGDAVVTRFGQSGTAKGVFTNGDIMVDISGFLQRKSLNDLGNGSVQPPSYPGDRESLFVGQAVWTRYGQSGTVAAIFANGDVSVDISGFLQTKKRDDLAAEGCATRDLCSGDRVITRYGQTGVLRGVFQNRTEAIVEVSGFLQLKNVNDIARTN